MNLGPELNEPVVPSLAEPQIYTGKIEGEFIHIDDFGNLIINITQEDLEKINLKKGSEIHLQLGNKEQTLRLSKAYGETSEGNPLLIIGSGKFLE